MANLKRSIVIKNQFTIRGADGEGSRGSTPGAYVERYMGRGEAIEPCLPVARTSPYEYLQRYAARKSAVEAAPNLEAARDGVKAVGEKDGVAFSTDSISLSEREFKGISHRIQDIYDAGEPVLKCVLSFDTDYLKENNLVPKSVRVKRDGDLRGQVDQLRLRTAICEGMRGLGNRFDDMVWVGVLQFDTQHVHAHLAIAEGNLDGEKRRRIDGEHRGMLSADEMRVLRNGVDRSLDLTHQLPYLSSEISNQRKNIRTFVRQFAADELAKSGDMQLILAALPNDSRVWRAGTSRRDMQRANELARDFVQRVLARPESGYERVESDIRVYAHQRAEREGGDVERERELVERGLTRVENECVNGVYAEVMQWQHRPIHTRPIDIMASDIAEAAQLARESDADAFMYRLRTFGGRMATARDKREEVHRARREWEHRYRHDQAAEVSRPAYEFYLVEEAYQTQVMCKYQSLFPLALLGDDDEEALERLRRAHNNRTGMESLLVDEQVHGMSPREAEAYGWETYGVRGGEWLVRSPQVYATRLEAAREREQYTYEEARFALAGAGRVLTMDDDAMSVRMGTILSFESVRGVDLHRLRYDFDSEAPVGNQALGQFREATMRRSQAVDAAAEYFRRSNQESFIAQLPIQEVASMQRALSVIEASRSLTTARETVVNRAPIYTVRAEPEIAELATQAVYRELEWAAADVTDDLREGLI